jgi:hypothetical protein
VQLGDLVAGQLDRAVARCFQRGGQVRRILPRPGRDADEDVRLAPAAQAVVEFRDHAAADGGTELAKRAGSLRDGDAEQRLARVADLGSLRDEAEAIEVHVCPAEDDSQPRARRARARHPRAQASDRQRAGGLQDRPGLVEHVFDGGADLIVGHPHDLLDRGLDDRERQLAHVAHGHAVGKDADPVERHPSAGGQRLKHRVSFVWLHADDANVRPQRLDVASDPRD